ncbi:hypothetical protein NU219Hw_g7020t1 [Hortaea werneckii]
MGEIIRQFDDTNHEGYLEGPRQPSSQVSPIEDGAASPSKSSGGEKGGGRSKEPDPHEHFQGNSRPEEEQAPQVPETQAQLRPISKGQCMIRHCGWDWSLIISLDEFQNVQDLIDKLIDQLHLKVEEQDQALFYHDHGSEKCTEMRQLSETSLELLRDANIDVHIVAEAVPSTETESVTLG